VGINQRQFTQLHEMGISVWHSRERGNNDAIPTTRVEDNTASSGDNLPLKSALNDELTSALEPALKVEKNTLATTSLESLNSSALFLNIIAVMEVSIGEVIEENGHYNLGLFNWHFYSTDINAEHITGQNPSCSQESTYGIAYQNNTLITPTIDCISTSALLKKQLWLTISNHIL
jgi:hypothetical protein